MLPEVVADLVSELSSESAILGAKLHPLTAQNLASLVRIMNTYYSNLIEGHDTRPRDIERALARDFDDDFSQRNLQLEAAAHVLVQEKVDQLAATNTLPEPASVDFIKWLHLEFFKDAPPEMLTLKSTQNKSITIAPGIFRHGKQQDVSAGRHWPPSSDRVNDFMSHFESRYKFATLGKSAQITAIASAHHRLNYIHPFPDGNGRVSRLMSHAMGLKAGIGAHGLWSISRGLARGLESRGDYKKMMDLADMPRQGDLDGRGNLSERALIYFTTWFLKVCLDQVRFMSDLFDLQNLEKRLKRYVEITPSLRPESFLLLQEALLRGEFQRGDAPRITGLPERSARRVIIELVNTGILASATPKGPLSLRFPASTLEVLFPKLYPES